ncbi:ketimine reductase mu-crystallin isoform X1 [Neodiprion pinetum]|uniref:ketimine reductase mu-crystallin isoform X1 n=2 Tax=Neodiprion pinetum TaxID=441929 RepID=UPI001EE100BB|nr:ketimine reductase mu-crystallin [Neodiprion pinetum]
MLKCLWLILVSELLIIGYSATNTSLTVTPLSGNNSAREMATGLPIFLNEARVSQLLDGQWLPLIDAMHQALLASALKHAVQPLRSFTPIRDEGIMLTMPGYVDFNNDVHEGEPVLACKVVTSFTGNSERENPLPNILGTILLFDVTSGKLTCVLEATEITARRTAAASVAATNILYKKRHSLSNSSDEPIVLGIFGAGVQGKNHALAFHAAYSNISEIRIWNHRLPKAERLVAELKTLGINQARVARTGRECAEGADILVTATSSSEPILFDEWVKNGAHINAVGSGRFHYCELDLPLYRRVKIYLDNESSGRNELRGLVVQGISLITSVGNVFLEPNLMPGKQDITVFHSIGMAAEDALAAQLVYKRHLLSRPSN